MNKIEKLEKYEKLAREILDKRYIHNEGYLLTEITATMTQLIMLDFMKMLDDNDIVKYIQFDKDGKIKVTTE